MSPPSKLPESNLLSSTHEETKFINQEKTPAHLPTSLVNPYRNRGTAFSNEQRRDLNLIGLLPDVVESIETQARRCAQQVRSCHDGISKYIFLLNLKLRNETLFYRVIVDNLYEMLPYVYTPTVGEACLKYSHIFVHPHGLYVSLNNRGHIKSLLKNWKQNDRDNVELIVVSDGSRILGLGDLGVNGMGIPVGKGSLYVAAGGFEPSTVLPIIVDTGTNNEVFLKDEFYLGLRQKRAADKEFYGLMDELLFEVKAKWPTCLVQFEDFSNDHCFDLLSMYRNQLLCFNDDIQGTGAVIASGILNAVKLAKIQSVPDLRIVFLGAGSAGVGVAEQISRCLHYRYNISLEDCHKMFYMIDSKGLITESREGVLVEYKKPYQRKDKLSNERNYRELLDIVNTFKPHALIGLSGQAGAFTDEVISAMATHHERPIIFPLSNPTKNSECTAEAAIRLTKGRVVFASGSPFDRVELDSKVFYPSQGNNMYVFPGLGFGAWLSRATAVSDRMITAAAITLADATSLEDLSEGRLYPPLSEVREVSAKIAAAVIDSSVSEGLSSFEVEGDLLSYVRGCMFFPKYID